MGVRDQDILWVVRLSMDVCFEDDLVYVYRRWNHVLCERTSTNFPPWDQKGKGVDWRETRNAAVRGALGGTSGPRWLQCQAQQTGL